MGGLLGGLDDECDPEVLRDIGRRFGGRLALDAEVVAEGAIAVGDAVRLEPATSSSRPANALMRAATPAKGGEGR